MNRSLLITLFVVGAFAFACVPRSRTDASTALLTAFRQSRSIISPAANTPVPPTTSHGTRDEKNDQTLSAELNVTAQPNEVLFVLDVTNGGSKRVEVNFPDGQTYDFEVVDSVGREVWHWAQGQIFTQSMQNKLLGKGQSMRISERWRAPRVGRYTAIARLRSSNYPVEQKVVFDVR
jgi:hypothetical protein